MSALDKVREWLKTFPGINRLHDLQVDYYDAQPDNGSIDPSGVQIISKTEDILGNVTLEKQYNFGLYFSLEKSPGDDAGATDNAAWVMDLQDWINDQSALYKAPTFGDEPKSEEIRAQNGGVHSASKEGVALYMVQLSINFIKKYEVN